ncbi:hypothetical protein AAG570_003152 [Ranatra chinensis]|uniref:Uncharacterized protein n=1 Tax=Ranatra chinensis TaxID=642074 RepID=A0ABD0Y6J9_9HEMI
MLFKNKKQETMEIEGMRVCTSKGRGVALLSILIFHTAVTTPVVRRDVMAALGQQEEAALEQVALLEDEVFGRSAVYDDSGDESARVKRFLKLSTLTGVVGGGLKTAAIGSAKAVGKAGLKAATSIGVKLAKAAVTIGIAKLLLSLVFGGWVEEDREDTWELGSFLGDWVCQIVGNGSDAFILPDRICKLIRITRNYRLNHLDDLHSWCKRWRVPLSRRLEGPPEAAFYVGEPRSAGCVIGLSADDFHLDLKGNEYQNQQHFFRARSCATGPQVDFRVAKHCSQALDKKGSQRTPPSNKTVTKHFDLFQKINQVIDLKSRLLNGGHASGGQGLFSISSLSAGSSSGPTSGSGGADDGGSAEGVPANTEAPAGEDAVRHMPSIPQSLDPNTDRQTHADPKLS